MKYIEYMKYADATIFCVFSVCGFICIEAVVVMFWFSLQTHNSVYGSPDKFWS